MTGAQYAIEEVGLLVEDLMVGKPGQSTDGWMATQLAGQACCAAFLHETRNNQLFSSSGFRVSL